MQTHCLIAVALSTQPFVLNFANIDLTIAKKLGPRQYFNPKKLLGNARLHNTNDVIKMG